MLSSPLQAIMNYFIAALALFLVEVLIATTFKDYHFIRAYLGDFLVVILLYCLLKAFFSFENRYLAWGIFMFASLLEVAQYFHLADHLQLSGIPRVIVGTSFSFYDILMYAAGCLTIYWLDIKILLAVAKS